MRRHEIVAVYENWKRHAQEFHPEEYDKLQRLLKRHAL